MKYSAKITRIGFSLYFPITKLLKNSKKRNWKNVDITLISETDEYVKIKISKRDD